MSALSQESYLNPRLPLWATNTSVFSSLVTSTLFVESSATITELNSFFISTQILEAEEAFVSSLSTLGIYLDGSLLTTAGSELLLNGIPIATTSNLSSLSDWSFDPAISTLNMGGNSTIGGSDLTFNSAHINQGFISSLVCNDISTTTLTVLSTIHVISSISSMEIAAQLGEFSTLLCQNGSVSSLMASTVNGQAFPAPLVSSFTTASISSLSASTINGVAFPSPQSTISTFATASISSLSASTINGAVFPQPVQNPSTVTGTVATVLGDGGAQIISPGTVNITGQNGQYGKVNVVANAGYLGNSGGQVNVTANGGLFYGAVNVTAQPGSVGGVDTGGVINLAANSGTSLSNATSAINLSAGGINIYAGVISPIGSIAGYMFLNGTAGISLCAGIPPTGFQVPLTTYLYGTAGIVLNSDVYTTALYPYWNGLTPPSDLSINGRTTISGSAKVNLNNVRNLNFDTGVTATINNLNALNFASGGTLTNVSQINGAAYPPAFVPPEDLALSTLTMNPAGFINVSSLSAVSITDVSTINGVAYPPEFGVPENLILSTIIMNPTGFINVSSLSAVSITEVSSINGVAYSGNISEDLALSTLTMNPAGFIIVPSISSLSSINGQSVNNPVVSSLTSQNISTYSLAVTYNGSNMNGIILGSDPESDYASLPLTFEYTSSLVLGRVPTIRAEIFGNDESIQGLLFQDFQSVGGFPSTLTTIGIRAIQFNDGLADRPWTTIYNSPFGSSIVLEAPHVDIINLSSISTINDQPWPPVVAIPTNLTLSTLLVSSVVSTLGIDNGGITTDLGYGIPNQLSLLYPSAAGQVNIIQKGYGPGHLDVGVLTSVSTINGSPIASFVLENGTPSFSTTTMSSIMTGGLTADAAEITTALIDSLINVSSIVGQSYTDPNITIQSFNSMTAANVSTLSLSMSSINGLPYSVPQGIDGAVQYVSAGVLQGDAGLIYRSMSTLEIIGSIIPTSTNTFTLGTSTNVWNEVWMGPGTLNIQGPMSTFGSLGTDANSIVYTQNGFAAPFINVGPNISTIGAIGGYQLITNYVSTTSSFVLTARANNTTPPYGQFGAFTGLTPALSVQSCPQLSVGATYQLSLTDANSYIMLISAQAVGQTGNYTLNFTNDGTFVGGNYFTIKNIDTTNPIDVQYNGTVVGTLQPVTTGTNNGFMCVFFLDPNNGPQIY